MIARACIVMLIVAGMTCLAGSAGVETAVAREPVAELSLDIGPWHGQDTAPYADDVVQELGVDEYVNRVYVAPNETPIALYVGYYASQRQGDTIHSPRNCLPGAGWAPLDRRIVSIPITGGSPIRVNRYLLQRGMDRELVLYWYEGRGHSIASDYVNRLWLMLDAARLRRTDGGLVRLIAAEGFDGGRRTADATAFAALLAPQLLKVLP